jgi:hypothetical protein
MQTILYSLLDFFQAFYTIGDEDIVSAGTDVC